MKKLITIPDELVDTLLLLPAEEYKKFSSKIPPKFGTYQNIMILDQINNFINLGVKLECNEVVFKLFKDEIKNICEDLQVYY